MRRSRSLSFRSFVEMRASNAESGPGDGGRRRLLHILGRTSGQSQRDSPVLYQTMVKSPNGARNILDEA